MRVHKSVFVFIMMQTVCTGVVVLSVDGEERERELCAPICDLMHCMCHKGYIHI